MGTMLNARGVGFEQCFDVLNLVQPGAVAEVHRAYIEAGAQVIQTNTFGANRYKLAAHGLGGQVEQINQAGVELARKVVMASFKDVLVAGDVGPLGVRLAPFGRVQPEQAREVFAEQIGALSGAGADLIILETFSDLSELEEAIAAARQACSLPLVASMTFTRDDRTLLGDTPGRVAQALYRSGADVIGVNCSGGPAQIWRILRQMRQALLSGSGKQSTQAEGSVWRAYAGEPAVGKDVEAGPMTSGSLPYFSAMPNAGWPERVGGRIMYPANPDYFGDYALAFCEAGASLIGGCCGTTPGHIAAMRVALATIPQGCRPTVAELSMPAEGEEGVDAGEPPSQLAQKLVSGRFVVSIEMDPPRGLSAHKLIAGASLLAEAGADVINVADSPMARMRMSPWAVCDLVQRDVGVETVLHFPTRGRNLLRVQGDLLAAHALGIRNVFVVMGDPTAIGDYPNAMDDYDLVPSGLIKLIKKNFNLGVDHAGADIGQPTSFFAGCALNLCPQEPDQEIKNLHKKIQAGADFILTQPVYQPEEAAAFLERYVSQHGRLETPVLVGILPLFSVRHALFLHNEVPGISISDKMHERIRRAGTDAPKEGIEIALELIDQMKPWASGIYLMPAFGRYDLAAELVERCR
jgi:homocysteine S-methyltransferase